MTSRFQEAHSEPTGHFLDELRATIASRANMEAVRFKDRSFTYGDLDGWAKCWARLLRETGVEPGDRVAIVTPDKLPFLAAHLGTLYAAAVSLPLNPRCTPDELRYFLEDSGAGSSWPATSNARSSSRCEPSCRSCAPWCPTPSPWRSHERSVSEPAVGRDAPCLMLYSSGTTGRPKGVVHTHANLASSLRALGQCWRFTPDDVLVNVLPLFHIHGLSFATHLSLLTGCRMHRGDDRSIPRQTLELVGRGTVFMAIPTFYYSFLERPEFSRAARSWTQRPAVHLRLGADPPRGAARAGIDPGPAGHQPLRHDRGARHHQPAARRAVAAGLGRPAARRRRGPSASPTTARLRPRARSARSSSAGRTCSGSTGASPRRPARRSPPAGSTPATWARATRPGS